MAEDSTPEHSKDTSTISTGGGYEYSSELEPILEEGADPMKAKFRKIIQEANCLDRRARDVATTENSGSGYEQSEGDSRTAGSQDYDVVEDQEQKPRTSREDDQAKLNRRLKEDAILREIAARDLKKEGRMDKMGARLLRRIKGGSKK